MGQYYIACIVSGSSVAEVLRCVRPFQFMEGWKLMEHSFLGNEFVESFEWLICPEGPYYNSRVVWAGDYADTEPGRETNLYNECGDKYISVETNTDMVNRFPFIVNHNKKLYVDKRKAVGGFFSSVITRFLY